MIWAWGGDAMRDRFTFVLTGFMACGKTTILKKLKKEQQLASYEFYDLDEEIEKDSNKTVSEIIEDLGMEYFRVLERGHLRNLILGATRHRIISLGGGAIDSEALNFLRKNKVSIIWINTPFEECLARIKQDPNTRPLSRLDDESLKSLYLKRSAFYEQSDLSVSIDQEQKLISFITSSTI